MGSYKERKSNNRYDILKQFTDDVKLKPSKQDSKRKNGNNDEVDSGYEMNGISNASGISNTNGTSNANGISNTNGTSNANGTINTSSINIFNRSNKNKLPRKTERIINDAYNFPSLGETLTPTPTLKPTTMNYLAVAKLEQKIETVVDEDNVNPGWVRLWKRDGIIYSKYGLQTKWRQDEYLRDQIDFDRVSYSILKQWQNERDEINELLGDRSPYYDTPSLLEYLPDEDDTTYEENDYNTDEYNS